jgi:hypothetical protein
MYDFMIESELIHDLSGHPALLRWDRGAFSRDRKGLRSEGLMRFPCKVGAVDSSAEGDDNRRHAFQQFLKFAFLIFKGHIEPPFTR